MKIEGYDYKVKCNQTVEDMGGETFGRVNIKTQTIEIGSDLHDQQKISSIFHEAVEAINYHLELNLEHPHITRLEGAIFRLIMDNNIDLTPLLANIEK